MAQDKELREEQQRRKRAEAAAQHSSKEKEAVKKGKKPFYPKKCKKFLLYDFLLLGDHAEDAMTWFAFFLVQVLRIGSYELTCYCY